MTDSSTSQLVGVAIPTLLELRAAVLTSSAPEAAVASLRDAGFAGGEAVHAAFERWLAETGEPSSEGDWSRADAGSLSIEDFGGRTSRFFRDAGWGEVSFQPDDTEGVAIVDIVDCWEGSADGGLAPGCHLTTGLLASFFGLIAGYPVAVLETECCGGDGTRCRFVMGNAEVMNAWWERLSVP